MKYNMTNPIYNQTSQRQTFKTLMPLAIMTINAKVSNAICIKNTIVYSEGKCPQGFNQLDSSKSFYPKFNPDSKTWGLFEGKEQVTLRKENMPLHDHPVAGETTSIRDDGETLGIGPYPLGDSESYHLKGTKAQATTFKTGKSGSKEPQPIDEPLHMNLNMCVCMVDGDGEYGWITSKIQGLTLSNSSQDGELSRIKKSYKTLQDHVKNQKLKLETIAKETKKKEIEKTGHSSSNTWGIIGTISGIFGSVCGTLAMGLYCRKRKQDSHQERLVQRPTKTDELSVIETK